MATTAAVTPTPITSVFLRQLGVANPFELAVADASAALNQTVTHLATTLTGLAEAERHLHTAYEDLQRIVATQMSDLAQGVAVDATWVADHGARIGKLASKIEELKARAAMLIEIHTALRA